MAISWLAVLQSVPWSEVISNAPKVADGARKLWNTVAGKPGDASAGAARQGGAASAQQTPSLAQLAARQAELENALADLHAQMLSSSALIKELADQNAQLVRRVETHRVRTLWLTAATGLLSAALLGVVLVWHTGTAA